MSRRTRQRRNRSESRQSRARCGSETIGGGQQAARQLLRRDRRSVQILCASEARLKQRLTENTSVYDHDSDLGSSLGEKRSFQCTRLPSYRRACKKVRLKHGRDRERTSACMAAGHSIDSILSSARPTLVPKGKKNDSRQGCVY